MKELICIVCPKGCHLSVDENDNYKVTGNSCPRGEEYGAAEKFFPDFPAPREGALRYKCLYLYKAARKAEVFAGWRYMCV